LDFFVSVVGIFDLSFCFVFDYLSTGFFSCVSFVSGCVMFFSVYYIGGSVDFRRFVFLVVIFVFSIFLLVFSRNFLLLFVG